MGGDDDIFKMVPIIISYSENEVILVFVVFVTNDESLLCLGSSVSTLHLSSFCMLTEII